MPDTDEINLIANYLRENERVSRISMSGIYLLDMIGLICYIVASLQPYYWACGINSGIAPWHIPHGFFQLFFISTAGMMFTLDGWLIAASMRISVRNTRMIALPLYVIIQGLNVIFNIVFVLCCDGFLEKGYLHIFVSILLTIIYWRRYLTLALQDRHTRKIQGGI